MFFRGGRVFVWFCGLGFEPRAAVPLPPPLPHLVREATAEDAAESDNSKYEVLCDSTLIVALVVSLIDPFKGNPILIVKAVAVAAGASLTTLWGYTFRRGPGCCLRRSHFSQTLNPKP